MVIFDATNLGTSETPTTIAVNNNNNNNDDRTDVPEIREAVKISFPKTHFPDRGASRQYLNTIEFDRAEYIITK